MDEERVESTVNEESELIPVSSAEIVETSNETESIIPVQKKKKTKLLIAIVGIVVLCIAAVIVLTNSPTFRFQSALKDGDYDTARAIYSQNKENGGFSGKANSAALKLLQKTEEKFAKGSITYDDAMAVVIGISSYDCGEEGRELKTAVNEINQSKKAFGNADAALQKEDYLSALRAYESVIEKDVEHYGNAQKGIETTRETLCSSAVENANKSISDGNYVDAFLTLDAVGEYSDDAVKTLQEEITKQAQEQIEKAANALIAQGDYKAAYQYLEKQPEELKTDKIKSIATTATEQLYAQAESFAGNGDYDGAIALLSNEDGKAINTDCESKIQDYKKSQNIVKLKALASGVRVRYDKIDKDYTLNTSSNFGQEIWNRRRNVYSNVRVNSGSEPIFAVFFGFRQDDWIFMDEIIVDCDGKQFELTVDYDTRTTKVGWSGILELTFFMDWDYKAENNVLPLEPMVNAMTTANEVCVRFRGDDGIKDVTISSSQISQIKQMWDIYQILKEDPSLVSVL